MYRSMASLMPVALGLAALAFPLQGQQQAGAAAATGQLELTSASEAAKREFRQLVVELGGLRPVQARQHAMNALAADPGFGLARLYLARPQLTPELSVGERASEMSKALAAMTNVSAPELLLGLYWREAVAGRAQVALPLLRMLAQLVPQDADVAFQLFTAERAGRSLTDIVRTEKELLERFPNFALGYNAYAYDLHFSGDHASDIVAVQQYARLAPLQPNALDSRADLELLHGNTNEAVVHVQEAIKLDSTWTNGYATMGAIKLAGGKADEARTFFNRAVAVATTAVARVDSRQWIAASYIYNRDAKSAMRELAAISDEVVAAKLTPTATALPHQRMALVEAFFGDKQNVAAHLAKAAAVVGANPLPQAAYAVLAYSAAGDIKAAQENADVLAKASGMNQPLLHALNALVAVASKNYAAAEKELTATGPNDLLAKAVRAEVLKSQGKKAEASALRDEVIKAGVKTDNNGTVDVFKLVAKLRVEKL